MDSKYFHRGREGRSRGEQRIIRDSRTSVKSRQEWYAGWDEVDRQRQPTQSPEAAAETEAALQGIRKFLQANQSKP